MEKSEILKKMNQIKTELKESNTKEDVDKLDVKFRGLQDELNRLEKASVEQRKKTLISEFEQVEESGNNDNFNADTGSINVLQRSNKNVNKATKDFYTADDKIYRTAWAKALMARPLNIEERKAINQVNSRALGTALSTTSETYVEATALVDGVNNGGLMIPSSVATDLLNEVSLNSPILNDINITSIKGNISYPYMKSITEASFKIEGESNVDGQFELAEFTLTGKEISETIPVTWKLESMTPDSFITYLINELRDLITEKLANGAIYGTGINEINGISNTELQADYNDGDNLIDHLAKSILLIPKRKRSGLKIYISDEMFTDLGLQKDGAGGYVYPQNGNGLLKILGKHEIIAEPYLQKDDFIIGNLSKYYKMNENEPFKTVKDVSGKKRINEYTSYAIVDGNFEPNTLVFGTKNI